MVDGTQGALSLHYVFAFASTHYAAIFEKTLEEVEVNATCCLIEQESELQPALSRLKPNILFYEEKVLSDEALKSTLSADIGSPPVLIKMVDEKVLKVVGHVQLDTKEYPIEDFKTLILELLVHENIKEIYSGVFARYEKFWSNASEGVVETDTRGFITAASPAAEKLMDAKTGALLGLNMNEHILLASEREGIDPLNKQVSSNLKVSDEGDSFVTLSGRKFPVKYTVSTLRRSNGRISGFLFIFTDVSEKIRNEEWVAYVSYYDQLTGLANRTLFSERIDTEIDLCARQYYNLGLLTLDINNFKIINDRYGFEVGDTLLVEVSKRIKKSIRSSDMLARLGGDEFAILMTQLKHNQDAAILARNIVNKLKKPFNLHGLEINISATVGIANYPECGQDAESLMKAADIAMFRAKKESENSYHFYSKTIHNEVVRNNEIQHELRYAIRRNEFCLHYQPQYQINSGKVVGVEALLRWKHPTYGLLGPDYFIDIAESSGLINPIGEWVLMQALTDFDGWVQQGILDSNGFKLGVNLSAHQLRFDQVVQTVNEALKKVSVPANCLDLEVTENAVIKDIDSTVEILSELDDLGASISIDDFGTGYCSLQYLQKFPISALKIDRSFLQGIPEEKNNGIIVQGTIAMAKALGLKVVAEGVEEAAQLDFLRENDCDVAQGYFLGRPQPSAALEQLFRQQDQRAVG